MCYQLSNTVIWNIVIHKHYCLLSNWDVEVVCYPVRTYRCITAEYLNLGSMKIIQGILRYKKSGSQNIKQNDDPHQSEDNNFEG
jgi:hypothetical protein